MLCKSAFSLPALALLTPMSPLYAKNVNPPERQVVETILEAFVEDYAHDPMARDVIFGIEVGENRWTVSSRMEGEVRRVALEESFGTRDMMYYTLDRETLHLIDRGVWNGLTAMAAATSADETPLEVEFTKGYKKPADYDAIFRQVTFHFWNRGYPEVTRFAIENSRITHGAPATVLYYDEDFRSAVYHVPAGLGRESAPTLATPFPRMILVLSGGAEGEMGGEAFSAQPGEMFFSPPNVPVTFWNASQDEVLSFVWLAWGDGA